jgi:hypothetical protein
MSLFTWLKGAFKGTPGDLLAHGIWEGATKFLSTKEGGQMALQVIRDTLSRGEAGGEGFSLLLARLSSNAHYKGLHDKFWSWVLEGNDATIRARLQCLQRALNFHYADVKDGIVAQVEVIILGEDGKTAVGKTCDWPKNFRPEDVFFQTWKAILRVEENHPGAIDKSIDFFTIGRETRLERWWSEFRRWLNGNPTWKKIKVVVEQLSWAYIATIAGLSVLSVLSAGVTLHFALEGKPGRTLVFLGITALLVGALYTVRYPLQQAWEFATSLVGGDGASWALQKRTIARRIGYLAAGSLILLLVPFGEHPTLLFTALIALVMTFMLHEHKSWRLFGQVVLGACIILSLVLPGPANADSENTEDETASTQALSDFVSELPKTVHSGRVYGQEFNGSNLFFSKNGEGKFCRPATDPANVGEGWWLEHVYTCDGTQPGFSPDTGTPGRVLSAEEAVEYLEWRESKREMDRGPDRRCQGETRIIGDENFVDVTPQAGWFVTPIRGRIEKLKYSSSGRVYGPTEASPEMNHVVAYSHDVDPIVRMEARAVSGTATLCLHPRPMKW